MPVKCGPADMSENEKERERRKEFIAIAVVYSGVYCNSNAKYVCDGSGNLRDDERGLKFQKPLEVS